MRLNDMNLHVLLALTALSLGSLCSCKRHSLNAHAVTVPEKAESLVLPEVFFENFPLDEAVHWFWVRGVELDSHSEPGDRGIPFFVSYWADDNTLITQRIRDIDQFPRRFEELRINLPAQHDVPYLNALAEACNQVGADAYLTSIGICVVLDGGPPATPPGIQEFTVMQCLTGRPEEPEPWQDIIAKLDSIIIPVVDFEDTSVEEAIDYLRVRSLELDKHPDPQFRGISMLMHGTAARADGSDDLSIDDDAPSSTRIARYQAENISLLEALIETCRITKLDAYLTSHGIVICPKGDKPRLDWRASGGEIWKKLTPP